MTADMEEGMRVSGVVVFVVGVMYGMSFGMLVYVALKVQDIAEVLAVS
jgi:hypothetical protein